MTWTTVKPAKPGHYVIRSSGNNDFSRTVRVIKMLNGFRVTNTNPHENPRHCRMSSIPNGVLEWLEIPE
jgi:hypothetical protein